MLQETWFYPDEFATVSQISDEFQSFNMSSMSLDDKLLTGRPHGGLSIMWNKSLSNSIKTLQYDGSRMLPGMKKTFQRFFISIFNCLLTL